MTGCPAKLHVRQAYRYLHAENEHVPWLNFKQMGKVGEAKDEGAEWENKGLCLTCSISLCWRSNAGTIHCSGMSWAVAIRLLIKIRHQSLTDRKVYILAR